tara:strand:- start:40 stop:150 length:111 start_codon:yes stop_codon:yes gene_type:complete
MKNNKKNENNKFILLTMAVAIGAFIALQLCYVMTIL